MGEFTFDGNFDFSMQAAANRYIQAFLLKVIPHATAVRSGDAREDRAGVDLWVERTGMPDASIDLKKRRVDPVQKYGPHCDDLALELWSDRVAQRVGWTLDRNKATDYICWAFDPTQRCVVLPFRKLLGAFTDNLPVWQKRYKHDEQTTWSGRNKWISECIFVPRLEVERAIKARSRGSFLDLI